MCFKTIANAYQTLALTKSSTYKKICINQNKYVSFPFYIHTIMLHMCIVKLFWLHWS